MAGRDIARLCDHDVSPECAFMLDEPLTELPEYFAPWMKMANDLQSLVKNDCIREAVHKMPLLDHTKLTNDKERRLAHVVLAFITNGYVWVKGEDHVPKMLPRNLAVPFAGVSDMLGMTKSLSNIDTVLSNWKLIDPNKPTELDNLDTIVKIACGRDESWFFMVAGAVEMDCATGLTAILKAQQAVADCNVELLKAALHDIECSLKKMTSSFARIDEKCNPDVFYNGFRPYLNGFDGAAFKNKGYNGIIFEGVSDEPMKFSGESSAQSSTIPTFDAALGVEHSPHAEKGRQQFREYMLPAHRDFVDAVANGPSIRTFVQNHVDDLDLVAAYNQCLDALEQFRSQHIRIVTRYIVIPSNKEDSNKKYASQGQEGTGGSGAGFMEFLRSLRDATKNAKLTTN